MNTIGFIGAGNMSGAIISGVISSQFTKAESLLVFDISTPHLDKVLGDNPGVQVAANNCELAGKSDIIVVAVKPGTVGSVLNEIKDSVKKDAIIVSIAAGITIDNIESHLAEGAKVVRCMPNTPAQVGQGMSVLCGNAHVSQEEMEEITRLFGSFGRALTLPESLFDAVTAVSGSGPAYVFIMLEALADGGVREGLPRDTAYVLAAQTVLGAATMVLETGRHPGLLKDMVTSPGGTAIEAVTSFEKNGLRHAIIEAVRTCTEKSSQLKEKHN